MPKYILFRDQVILQPILEDKTNNEDFLAPNSSSSQQTNPLFTIRLKATHSGRPTRNNGFYLPHKMRDGVLSWVTPFKKPILLHHEDYADPIGRVQSATYVDLSHKFKSQHMLIGGGKDISTDMSMMDSFIAGSIPVKKSLSLIHKYLLSDILDEDPDYEGLGYVELVASISDPSAMKKILDERYLTGSVGVSTDAAVCSICGCDWAAEEDICEHRPGNIYDGKRAVIIAGDLKYEEWSFVNRPADTQSRVIETNIQQIRDFFQVPKPESMKQINMILNRFDSQEEFFMPEENSNVLPEEDVKMEEEKDAVKEFWGEEYDEIVGDDEWGRDYAEMMMTLLEDEEDKEKAKQLVKDAKLTTAKRKELPGSSFCGPNRSFPVPDCAHYTAALRLIGRYKGPGDKDRIRACVMRKGERMGCTKSKSKDSVDVGLFVVDFFDQYQDEELLQMLDGLKLVLSTRNLQIEDNTCQCNKVLEDQVLELQNQLQVTKESSSAELLEVQNQLKVTQEELVALRTDIEHTQLSLEDQIKVNRNMKIEKIFDSRLLSGEKVQLELINDELKDKSIQEIDNLMQDSVSKIDILQIADKLNSGLSRLPTETVLDPTLQQNNACSQQQVLFDAKVAQQVRENYFYLRFKKSQQAAEQYLEDCKAKGIIPNKYPENNK